MHLNIDFVCILHIFCAKFLSGMIYFQSFFEFTPYQNSMMQFELWKNLNFNQILMIKIKSNFEIYFESTNQTLHNKKNQIKQYFE